MLGKYQRSGAGKIPKDPTGTGKVPRDLTGAGKSSQRSSAGKVPRDPTGAGKYPEIQVVLGKVPRDPVLGPSSKVIIWFLRNILNTYSLVWNFFEKSSLWILFLGQRTQRSNWCWKVPRDPTGDGKIPRDPVLGPCSKVIIWFFRNILNTYSLVWIFFDCLWILYLFIFLLGKELRDPTGAGKYPKIQLVLGKYPEI